MSQKTLDMLEANGWVVECESPLEIRHAESESFASGLAANMVVDALNEVQEDLSVLFARLASLNAELQGLVSRQWEDWSLPYNLVFSGNLSSRIFNTVTRMGLTLSWDDPDADYADDVCAYARAVDELCRQLAPSFPGRDSA